jgi:hypothetical protein
VRVCPYIHIYTYIYIYIHAHCLVLFSIVSIISSISIISISISIISSTTKTTNNSTTNNYTTSSSNVTEYAQKSGKRWNFDKNDKIMGVSACTTIDMGTHYHPAFKNWMLRWCDFRPRRPILRPDTHLRVSMKIIGVASFVYSASRTTSHGKTSHIWEVFPCTGRLPIYGKSSHTECSIGGVNLEFGSKFPKLKNN